jgi:hypothetical protein
MGKISDIWVRLGLKKDGFDKGMDDAAKKADKTGGKMSKMLNAAKAGWAAVGAAVIAFGHEMINATNKVGDAWNHTMAGIKGGWQSVLADISNYKPDFSSFRNFFKNEWKWIKDTFGSAKEAGEAAREMSKAFDAEFELENSLKIQRAKISGELADLQVEMRNTALSPQERKAATERYRALLEPLYKAEIATRKNMLDEAVKAWLAGTGVRASTQQVSDFFANYGINPTAAAAANPELARVYETLRGDADTQPLIDALIRAGQAAGAYAGETRKVQSALNTATAALESATEILEEASSERQDISIPALAGIQGKAVSMTPDLISREWLDENRERGLEALAMQTEWNEIMAEGAMALEDTIVQSMGNGLQAITDMMMGIQGVDASSALAALMAPFGNFAKQMGAMIVSYGLSMDAFKNAFAVPGVAIAAGAGLMAIGAAISSGAQRLSQGSLSGGTSAAYTGGSPRNTDISNYESTLNIEVMGRISGSDIVISGSKTNDKWNR